MIQRTSVVYQVPSATFHHTYGDKYIYLNFTDRNTTIKYQKTSPRGRKLMSMLVKRGFERTSYTFAK